MRNIPIHKRTLLITGARLRKSKQPKQVHTITKASSHGTNCFEI